MSAPRKLRELNEKNRMGRIAPNGSLLKYIFMCFVDVRALHCIRPLPELLNQRKPHAELVNNPASSRIHAAFRCL